MTIELNRPEILAEVRATFDAYERALVANDVPTMDALFWQAPEVVRYGIAEIQHGAARRSAPGARAASRCRPRAACIAG